MQLETASVRGGQTLHKCANFLGTAQVNDRNLWPDSQAYSLDTRAVDPIEVPHELQEGQELLVQLFAAANRKIGPNNDGLVHVSEIAPFRIDKVTDAVAIGDVVPVVIKEIDEKGRYNLSIKAADPEWAARKGIKPGQGGGNDYGRRNSNDRPRRHI